MEKKTQKTHKATNLQVVKLIEKLAVFRGMCIITNMTSTKNLCITQQTNIGKTRKR